MTIFYFTATGNSLAVAKTIGGKLISIPQVVDSDTMRFKDDAIGIVFPIYSWSLPVMVRRFVERANFEADYLFAIGTYGSIPGGAMASLRKLAQKSGFSFDYTNKLLMLDNFLPIFEVGAQIEKLPKKQVEKNLADIADDIKNCKHMHVKANPFAKVVTRIVGGMFNPSKSALKYIVNEKCSNCGVCAKVCPAKNITVTDKVQFNENCEGCLACIHLCPQNTLHHKGEKSGKRWRNPDTPLEEIITANNRT